MSEFEREDQQVMDVVNGHGTPEAERAAEEIAREVEEKRQAAWGMDCAPCDAGGYGYQQGKTEGNNPSVSCADTSPYTEEARFDSDKEEGTCGMSRKALRQNFWHETWRTICEVIQLILIELLGYAALGGVLVAGMALGVVSMKVAVPVFVACFMWVAVRLDRWMRG